jgi:hypothetical protein
MPNNQDIKNAMDSLSQSVTQGTVINDSSSSNIKTKTNLKKILPQNKK